MMFYFAALPVTAVKVKVGIPFWRPLLRSGEHPTSKQTFAQKNSSVVVSTQLKRNSNVTIIGVFVLKGLVIAEKISPRTHFPLPTSATNKKHAQGPAKPKPPRDVRPKPPGFGKKKHLLI